MLAYREEDQTRELTGLKSGSRFYLSLREIPSTGFAWAVKSSPGQLRVLGDSWRLWPGQLQALGVAAEDLPGPDGDPELCGGEFRRILIFEVAGELGNQASLHLAYERSFSGEVARQLELALRP